jgi:hypothetical protein
VPGAIDAQAAASAHGVPSGAHSEQEHRRVEEPNQERVRLFRFQCPVPLLCWRGTAPRASEQSSGHYHRPPRFGAEFGSLPPPPALRSRVRVTTSNNTSRAGAAGVSSSWSAECSQTMPSAIAGALRVCSPMRRSHKDQASFMTFWLLTRYVSVRSTSAAATGTSHSSVGRNDRNKHGLLCFVFRYQPAHQQKFANQEWNATKALRVTYDLLQPAKSSQGIRIYRMPINRPRYLRWGDENWQ